METVKAAFGIDAEAFDVLPDPVVVIRRDRIAWANAAAAAVLGRPRESLQNCSLEEILPPEENERLAARLCTTGAHLWTPFRCRLLRQDGRQVTMDVRAWPLGGRSLPIFVLVARDVTQSARSEALVQALGRAVAGEAPLDVDAILDAAEPVLRTMGWSASVWSVHPDGARLDRILADRRGEPVWDYQRTLEGRVIPLDRLPAIARVVREDRGTFFEEAPILTGTARSFERAMLREDAVEGAPSERRYLHGAWVPIRARKRPSHVLTVVGADLCEQDFVAIQLLADRLSAAYAHAELQTELRQLERRRTTGRLAGQLSEELRNPVVNLLLAARALRRRDNEEIQGLGDVVEEEARRLARLIDEPIESGGLAKDVEPQPVSELALRAVSMAVESSDAVSAHDVEVEVSSGTPPIFSDPDLFCRTIANLVVEVARMSGPQGRVVVSANADEDGLRLSVVTEPPGQTPPDDTLGMAIAHRLARRIGGTLERDDGMLSLRLPTA